MQLEAVVARGLLEYRELVRVLVEMVAQDLFLLLQAHQSNMLAAVAAERTTMLLVLWQA
jgi:hypothetical protein